MDTKVEIFNRQDTRRIEIVISIPFENYARGLWPNEELRESVNKGMEAAIEHYATNRR